MPNTYIECSRKCNGMWMSCLRNVTECRRSNDRMLQNDLQTKLDTSISYHFGTFR